MRFVTGAAHKLAARAGWLLEDTAQVEDQFPVFGGKQERGQRPGTENLPIILSMLAALDIREANRRGATIRPAPSGKRSLKTLVASKCPHHRCRPQHTAPVEHHVRTDARRRSATLGHAHPTKRALPSALVRPAPPAGKNRHTSSARWATKPVKSRKSCASAAAGETTAADWEALEQGIVVVYGEMHGNNF